MVVLVALALRLGWWAAYVRVIENEGVVYARLAQSLFAGEGMTSIFGGRDVMFPPLYPAAIGLLATLTGTEEVAGRLIGVLCGTALVGVLYRIGALLFDHKAALAIAALAAVHPMLIGLSTSLYSEGPWILLVVCALYCVLRSRAESTAWLAAAGLCTGLAYLVRPEALVFVGYFAFAVAVWSVLQRRLVGPTVRAAGTLVAVALLVALPYMAHLSSLAGTFRWEGKSAYNNIQNERIRAGMSIPQAARGIDADGRAGGVFLNLHEDQAPMLRTSGAGAGSLLRTLTTSVPQRAVRIVRQLLDARFVSAPWAIGLAAVAVFALPWWRARRVEGLIVLGVPLLQLLLLLSVDQAWNRYFFAIAPLLMVWAGAGIARIAQFAAQRLRAPSDRTRARLEYAAAAIGIAGVTLLAFNSVRSLGELTQAEDLASRDLGLWMAGDAAARDPDTPPIVMGIGLAPVYYARGTMRYLPYADEAAALDYVRRMRPRYIVLRDFETKQVPYGAAWLERGIDDACAKPVMPLPTTATERSRMWRWDCREAPR
jgi:4-amino-4-deoxy-L-arabinose transferase-like glycosyltransferase